MDVTVAVAVLFGAFFILLVLGVPISVGIGIASFLTALVFLPWEDSTFIVGQGMIVGVESFSLLAVPLFIFAGNIMNNGGIARRLVDLALVVAGRVPGALAHTNVLGNMLFGSLSGSAVAAAAAIGGTLHEQQKKEGYDPSFGAAVNIASASTGLLIPPTTAAIVYSTVGGGVSVAALFMAGYVPGILMGIVVMVVAYLFTRGKPGYARRGKVTAGEAVKVFLQAVPSLLLIVIVVGGIVTGVFTATEGAGAAVLYCFVLSLIYRSMSWADFKEVITRTVVATGVVMFLIAASSAMSWVMAYTGIPTAISDALLGTTDSPVLILLLMVVILLVVGTFMDITPAILIFTPIFLPIATELGMDPVHFGMVLILAMCIGTMTPPVGSVLFIGAGVADVTIEQVVPKLIPFFVGLVLLLLAITYIPALSLAIPGWMGLLG